MVKKISKTSAANKATASASGIAGAARDSAQQIWLAGLASFTKAQKEGGKVVEALVKEGLAIQRKTQAVAEERISEVSNKAAGVANEFASKASGQWNKLEDIFEERVARALNKLGVPSAKDVDALIGRIDDLSKQVSKLGGKATPVRAAAKKAPVKSAAKKVVRAVKTATKSARKA
jgi:poly(hydroxyalkanoate) granule-associated protein